MGLASYGGRPAQRFLMGDCVTRGVSKQLITMLLSLAVVLTLLASGCIEVKDKPPHGEFTMELHSNEMFFVPDGGGELEGAHAHVDTDLHHEHPEYSWNITGLTTLKGSKVDVPPTGQGMRKADYVLEYYEQHNQTSVLLSTVPNLSGIYFAVGNGTGLMAHEDDEHSGVNVEMGPALTTIASDDTGQVMEFSGRLSDGISVNVTMDHEGGNSTSYVLGVWVQTVSSTDLVSESLKIFKGEVHMLHYVDEELNLTIAREDDPTNVTFEGTIGDLPEGYHTHIGSLEWEGTVGEVEESPGMGAWAAVVAFATLAAVMVRRRR